MVHPTTEFARCFLRLADVPNYALDRLCRYEATLWRQVRQILFALDALGRRKPQDRIRPFRLGSLKDCRPRFRQVLAFELVDEGTARADKHPDVKRSAGAAAQSR